VDDPAPTTDTQVTETHTVTTTTTDGTTADDTAASGAQSADATLPLTGDLPGGDESAAAHGGPTQTLTAEPAASAVPTPDSSSSVVIIAGIIVFILGVCAFGLAMTHGRQRKTAEVTDTVD
jgi:hypothetical protein